jgi:hypothetical protein
MAPTDASQGLHAVVTVVGWIVVVILTLGGALALAGAISSRSERREQRAAREEHRALMARIDAQIEARDAMYEKYHDEWMTALTAKTPDVVDQVNAHMEMHEHWFQCRICRDVVKSRVVITRGMTHAELRQEVMSAFDRMTVDHNALYHPELLDGEERGW